MKMSDKIITSSNYTIEDIDTDSVVYDANRNTHILNETAKFILENINGDSFLDLYNRVIDHYKIVINEENELVYQKVIIDFVEKLVAVGLVRIIGDDNE